MNYAEYLMGASVSCR